MVTYMADVKHTIDYREGIEKCIRLRFLLHPFFLLATRATSALILIAITIWGDHNMSMDAG